jgi:hypothetical protein
MRRIEEDDAAEHANAPLAADTDDDDDDPE